MSNAPRVVVDPAALTEFGAHLTPAAADLGAADAVVRQAEVKAPAFGTIPESAAVLAAYLGFLENTGDSLQEASAELMSLASTIAFSGGAFEDQDDDSARSFRLPTLPYDGLIYP